MLGVDFEAIEADPQWEVFIMDILELNLVCFLLK
jgi:hypothetical protein